MKFIRLRIANYRGVVSKDISFGPSGITLIQGPNEAGKTSLSEAIRILFEYMDSSKHRDVEAIKPVHRDEGPEIELQAESGTYSFTYFKRFLKKPETKLTVNRPVPENYTGREAHERAEAILRETLDIDLWKALTIQQGDAINQPILTQQTSLSAALDRAAGGRPVSAQEEGLFDRVHNEYLLYFTERGQVRKDLDEARKSQTNAKLEVDHIEQAIRDLDKDIDLALALQREMSQLNLQEGAFAEELVTHSSSLEEIDNLERALSAARLRLGSAKMLEQVARQDKEVRQSLVDAVANSAKDHGHFERLSIESLELLNSAESGLKAAQKELDESGLTMRAADANAALRRADFDYYTNKLFLEQLLERKDRIDSARKNAATAEALLARNRVDSAALEAIQQSEQKLLIARAQMQTSAPSVLLRALVDCRLSINEADVTFDKGESQTIPVADKVRMAVPGTLEIEITAGSSTEGLSRKVAESSQALESACSRAGVASPDEARRAHEERREATRTVESIQNLEKVELRDLTYEVLAKKVLDLQQVVPDYLATRIAEPLICSDLDSAKLEWTIAARVQLETAKNWESAHQRLDAARSAGEKLKAKHQDSAIRLEVLSENLSIAQENLDRARQSVSDNALETALADANHAINIEGASVHAAEISLAAKNPEKVRALEETTRGSLLRTQSRRNDAQKELIQVETRLKIHGEEGLHERLHQAQSVLERLEVNNKSLFRRASAAKSLYDVMREERERARQAYVAPLKEKIERLGRLVFDDSFQVNISDELQIASRTVNGVTVPFGSLSGGTREQLSLIFRSACSMIVAKDGGMPLVLDDALGNTDSERLRLMGAVLATAAKECQIVIFTCLPDRYSNIGGATVVSLK